MNYSVKEISDLFSIEVNKLVNYVNGVSFLLKVNKKNKLFNKGLLNDDGDVTLEMTDDVQVINGIKTHAQRPKTFYVEDGIYPISTEDAIGIMKNGNDLIRLIKTEDEKIIFIPESTMKSSIEDLYLVIDDISNFEKSNEIGRFAPENHFIKISDDLINKGLRYDKNAITDLAKLIMTRKIKAFFFDESENGKERKSVFECDDILEKLDQMAWGSWFDRKTLDSVYVLND